jgi:urea transporter/murein DD-endopeptidase MepM/ murein hydrolase activator NlpD
LKISENIRLFIQGILNSFSQVFFSVNKVFALVILLVTFFDFVAGISGLLAVIVTTTVGYGFGFDKHKIIKGFYGFNSLLVGLGLGIYFEPGLPLFFILILASVFTLFISVSLEGVIGKYALPYLSIPFLLSLWTVSIATRQFEALGVSQRGIFTLNDLYIIGGNTLVQVYDWWNNLEIPGSIRTYFISLGAILFQFNVLSGIIIALGLLYYSRIGFSLSLIGFYTAYLFYEIIGANLTEVNYSYIGFNYILTSIAIGGFFIIPSRLSYIWTIILIPLVAIITISLNSIFITFQLPIYSLPFNIVVLLFLYVLKFRIKPVTSLSEVYIQQNSPEKNLYSFQNDIIRFRHKLKIPFRLPFWGTWTVSQAHNGEHTHKGDWKHAWDFVITEQNGEQFKEKGDCLEDYFCYNKDVLSPANGTVEEVIDGVEDNVIGDVNLINNWGNTIVIKHTDFLYSKLSHLKPDSIKVSKGEKVQSGQVIAKTGNSGRSPYPHLHFQFQGTPYVGSKTIDYPFSYYILAKDDNYSLKSFENPQLDDHISNIEVNPLLKNAFHLIPGKRIRFEVKDKGIGETVNWEVSTDIYNNSFIKCEKTDSIAYFESDGNLLYFKHFEGNRSSLLYYFFLGAFKIQMGFYKDMTLKDQFPVNLLFKKTSLFFHDFIAPFFSYMKAVYSVNYEFLDSLLTPSSVILKSQVMTSLFGRTKNKINFFLKLNTNGIEEFEVILKNRKIEAKCLN